MNPKQFLSLPPRQTAAPSPQKGRSSFALLAAVLGCEGWMNFEFALQEKVSRVAFEFRNVLTSKN